MSSGRPSRIILVDDEEALAWSLSSRLAKVRPQHTVETATDGTSALVLMQRGEVDLLVADIRMPGMNGIDLVLTARSTTPDLPVIVMTAFTSADIQRIHGGPFTGFLEKPFEFERLLDLVDRALAPKVVGFSGAISVQTLPDIVQLYVLSSATGVLSIKHHSGEGGVWFERGSIMHAVTPTRIGDEAFYEIMMWSGGEFTMRAGARTTERSVRSNWQELLMESCRRIDEQGRAGSVDDDERPPSSRGWTQAPPPSQELQGELDTLFQDFEPRTAKVAVIDSNEQTERKPSLEGSMNIKDSLSKLNQIDGFVGAALVDSESGMLLGQEGGGGLNLEVAAAGNTEVVRAKRKTMNNLNLKENIEDILISLTKQYHLIRPLRSRPTLFFYVALDRQRANLAMARIALADVEKDLTV
jgi:CheY-like chemotaxis protein/predicted regulator of Ras-like GTPase activity (Roadblock/LC7/MglB family)